MSSTADKTRVIADNLILKIQERLLEGRQVRRSLPLDGRLHIDRALPFLIVYRQPQNRSDNGTERLVKGEASYLIASGSARLKTSLTRLTSTIVNTLSEEFGAFLILEIWSSQPLQDAEEDDQLEPGFRIITSTFRPPTRSVEALEKGLKRLRILKKRASTTVVFSRDRSPNGLPPLLSNAEARKLNCYIVGLEIDPVFRDPENGDIYPLVLRTLHRGLSRAIKRAVFEFAHSQTTHRPPSHQALGRRAVVKAVWEIDRALAQISAGYDFLLQVTPSNTMTAWNAFRSSRFEKPPVLYYRPLPVDPALLKRKLYQIRIERVEDPTLAALFRETREELDRQLTVLSDRGSPEFLYGSLQLFGGVDEELLQEARRILSQLRPRSRDESLRHAHTAEEFAELARQELSYYRGLYSEMNSRVYVRDDIVGLMVSQGNLLIGKQTRIPHNRTSALLQHEIGTHVLTYFNGRAQPFRQLYCGLAGYEPLQEGLAVLSEYFVGQMSRPRLRLLAGRVIGVRRLIEGATFIETFRELNREHGFEQRTAFTITVRVFRGGGLTKDAVYLRGLVELLSYLKSGGQLAPLYVGKIAAKHVPLVEELRHREVLHAPLLEPRYIQYPLFETKLAKLRAGLTPLELCERRG